MTDGKECEDSDMESDSAPLVTEPTLESSEKQRFCQPKTL